MRTELELNKKQILENPFLVADFIFEEEKREQLSKCNPETLKIFLSYFEDEKNFERIVNLFKGELYENYYDFRQGEGQFKAVVQAIIQGLSHAPVFRISRALVNFFYGDRAIKNDLNSFVSEIKEALNKALGEEEEYQEIFSKNLMGHLKRVGYK